MVNMPSAPRSMILFQPNLVQMFQKTKARKHDRKIHRQLPYRNVWREIKLKTLPVMKMILKQVFKVLTKLLKTRAWSAFPTCQYTKIQAQSSTSSFSPDSFYDF